MNGSFRKCEYGKFLTGEFFAGCEKPRAGFDFVRKFCFAQLVYTMFVEFDFNSDIRDNRVLIDDNYANYKDSIC